METLFWLSVAGVAYPYAGYPALLWLLSRVVGYPDRRSEEVVNPSVSLLIPFHNEESRVVAKIRNTSDLHYTSGRLQILLVSDGSTDNTVPLLHQYATAEMRVLALPARRGKAAALNAALQHATNEIVVFVDASIALEPHALDQIVQPFRDARVGCVSGEDRIGEVSGEGAYGRYELWLRRLESRLFSIVGASGSFYAQRRPLVAPFLEGMAPDFLSVLRTVEQGYRAVSEPQAIGHMTSLTSVSGEFDRKVRTILRGMTTLFACAHLLNPWRHGWFAFELWSHKVLRWTVPYCLIGCLLAPLALLDSAGYAALVAMQVGFYAAALLALGGWTFVERSLLGRIALYFAMTNAATLVAWFRFATGHRQELWTPSRR